MDSLRSSTSPVDPVTVMASCRIGIAFYSHYKVRSPMFYKTRMANAFLASDVYPKYIGYRSEERRVGKECRSRGAPQHQRNEESTASAVDERERTEGSD